MMPKNQSLALPMLGSSMGTGMASELYPDVLRDKKKFQVTTLTMPNNFSYINDAEKSVPGLADVGVPHGDGDGPVTMAPGPGSKIRPHHVDQHEKLKGLDVQKST